ncbi:hypothetical protein DKX38_003008 [Salix brachista]|uniref:Uncharacterized protein n=1 Tax=Salix brachista TaxID=2182728 RepID=A0A5N5NNM4_9ROSI|nr:hypothetical protein DKX38_003008 [Salix brachista]
MNGSLLDVRNAGCLGTVCMVDKGNEVVEVARRNTSAARTQERETSQTTSQNHDHQHQPSKYTLKVIMKGRTKATPEDLVQEITEDLREMNGKTVKPSKRGTTKSMQEEPSEFDNEARAQKGKMKMDDLLMCTVNDSASLQSQATC